jgi:hypothetical protein
VVGGAVVFREVVAAVGRARAPVVLELILLIAVVEPPKMHVHGFCAVGQDVVGHDAQGSAIVSLDWGGGLFVAQFVKEGSTWHGFVHV